MIQTRSRIFKKLETTAEEAEIIQSSRHAAAVVHKGKIISIGVSKLKTHPLMCKFQNNEKRIYLHAEIDAIVKAINKFGNDFLSSCDLYVLRLTRGNHIGISRPCPGCERAIKAFKFKNVYWTDSQN